jgi:two-component system KDP operon response regulator KdpE
MKPIATGELLARIRVALRHARARAALAEVMDVGPIRIDHARHEVAVGGAPVHLTPIEFKLLAALARNPGKVVTREELLRHVWGPRVTEPHYLRVHIATIRQKIEKNPSRPRWLTTVTGVGYRLRDA